MNTELLKLRILVAIQDLKISFYMQKFSLFQCTPLSASAPSLRLLWRPALNVTGHILDLYLFSGNPAFYPKIARLSGGWILLDFL